MVRCVTCGVIAKHMYEIAVRGEPMETVGVICWDCKEELVQGGADADVDGSCGYADPCAAPVRYVALVQDTVTTDSGVDIVTEQENLICERHFRELVDDR